jgi:hypothetical protein
VSGPELGTSINRMIWRAMAADALIWTVGKPERLILAHFLLFSAQISFSGRTYPAAARRSWKIRRFIL